jgi:hypothetical protein
MIPRHLRCRLICRSSEPAPLPGRLQVAQPARGAAAFIDDDETVDLGWSSPKCTDTSVPLLGRR